MNPHMVGDPLPAGFEMLNESSTQSPMDPPMVEEAVVAATRTVVPTTGEAMSNI